jgi:hypothetical protein
MPVIPAEWGRMASCNGMLRIDLDQLQDGWVQYKQSQEYEDYYGVECVRNIEMDIVLNAPKVLKIVGSRTQ